MSEDIVFDFGLDFKSAAERIKGERDDRMKLAARTLKYNIAYLDDTLRGLRPHDLVLIGAATGAGKTEFVTQIARLTSAAGKRVHYFALEAEPLEIERRIKHSIINECSQFGGSYPDWFLGLWQPDLGIEEIVEKRMAQECATLHTYYRGSTFTPQDIRKLFTAVQSETDLIILDHVHFVDHEDENENRGLKTTIQLIRDVALGTGKPVILIGHLRKRDIRTRSIVPDIDDFHGSSDLTKICTQAILISPARNQTAPKGSVGTYMAVVKNRFGGVTGHVALCWFDLARKQYADGYHLGFPSDDGKGFALVPKEQTPAWAKRAVQ